MIAADWGTSNFRAFRLDGKGGIVDRRSSAKGVRHVLPGEFPAVLQREVQPWLADGETTLVVCGMAGSRGGWTETGYVPCPASANDLAHGLVEVPFAGGRAWIVPGVECTTAEGVPEVMRGEETAIIGAMELVGSDGILCLPGTHSKWVTVRDGRMQSFRTSMTGEIFSTLRRHTILSQFLNDGAVEDMNTFHEGVEHSAQTGGLLHHIFRVRTLPLKNLLPQDSTGAFLSGLLIGSEVRAMLPPGGHVLLLGADGLCKLYAAAISQCGGTAALGGAETAAQGIFLLSRENRQQGREA